MPVASRAHVVADRVDRGGHGDAELVQEIVGETDDLRIGLRRGKAEAFDAELVGLPVAPRLGPLVSEDRADVVQTLRSEREEVVLESRAHDGCRPLRTQGHRAVALVAERVHLFFDDVGRFADAAYEQLGRLEDRRANLPVTEAPRDRARRRFEC
jgi:hypothetical protein